MPAEVYSISGAFGGEDQCPEGWEVTPAGNCGAPKGDCPPQYMTKAGPCRSVLALNLQNSLRSLGLTTGDQQLSSLSVDGFVGPKTTAAVNRAMTTHVGAAQAGADLRSGTLSQADVAANAQQLAQILAQETVRRGGKVQPKVPVGAPGPAPASPVPTPGPATRKDAGKMWALLGLELLAVGIGVYGTVKRKKVGDSVDLPSHIVPFPEAS